MAKFSFKYSWYTLQYIQSWHFLTDFSKKDLFSLILLPLRTIFYRATQHCTLEIRCLRKATTKTVGLGSATNSPNDIPSNQVDLIPKAAVGRFRSTQRSSERASSMSIWTKMAGEEKASRLIGDVWETQKQIRIGTRKRNHPASVYCPCVLRACTPGTPVSPFSALRLFTYIHRI